MISEKSGPAAGRSCWRERKAFTLIETAVALLVTLSGVLLLSGVVCCLKLTLDSRRSTERFQYSRVLNIIYSDQLDLTGCIAQDTQKRYFTLYYSPKTKKYYSLEYYAYRKALVMETCDEGSGKMPLMYGARSFKVETSGRTWPVMTLVLDDGTTFRQQLVIPARYAGDGGDLR